jgi:hypothetical protein
VHADQARPTSEPDDHGAWLRTMPMVGRVTGRSAVVNLVTSESPPGAVGVRARWAPVGDELPVSPAMSGPVWTSSPQARIELPIDGLRPDSAYTYRVEYATESEPHVWRALPWTGRFTTQRSAGEAFRVCLIADPHWGAAWNMVRDGPRWWTGQQCLRQICADGHYDFLVDLGDSPALKGIRSFDDALARYAQYREVMAPVLQAMPAYLVLGNHEEEAGFKQRGGADGPLSNDLGPTEFHQKWATEARLRCIPNPRGDTYPEGGEGAPGYDSLADWLGPAQGAWNNGTRSHL